LICCSAALGLCALYQSLGFAARRAHVVDPDGKGHYTVEVFDGARWYVVDPDFDFLARSAAGELLDAAETVRRLRDGGADLALESLTRKRRSDRLAGLQEVNDHLRTLGVRVSDPSRVKDWDVEYEFSGSLTWTPVAESGLKVSDTALDYLRTMSVATPLGHAIAHGLIASQDTSLFHIGVDGRPREPGPAAPAFGRDVTPPSLLMTLPPTFEPRGPFGWVARLPAALTPLSDNDAAVAGSPLSLFEDERELGPGHEEHAMICGLGGGAYSFWKDELYFSTPDRSNPNTNGRAYTVRRTE
jgi:hypothetical protein